MEPNLTLLCLLGAGVAAVIYALRASLKGLEQSTLWLRVLPLLPVVLGGLGGLKLATAPQAAPKKEAKKDAA